MRRKRRKAYKKWKILNTAVCASQLPGHTGQQNIKDVEKEAKADTSEAVFHQTGALGKSKENGGEQMSASVNGKQNSCFLLKAEKQSPSDSKIHRRKGNDGPPLAVAHQLKKVLPVVMFNDCEESLSEKITPQNFPSTVGFKPEKGKCITEAKCGTFKVQVEIKKNISHKAGTQSSKKRCPACHQQFPISRMRKCCTLRRCFPKYNHKLAEESKPEVPSKYKEVSRTESPFLKVSIIGKEIKVKYMSKKQNIFINITHPKRREKITKYRNISSNHTTEEPSRSPSQSSAEQPGKWILENQHQIADCLSVSPPNMFTAQKENCDIAVTSLTSTPKRDKNKPNSLSSGSNGSTISQQEVLTTGQHTPQKSLFSAADTLHVNIHPTSRDTLQITSNTDVSKMSSEDPKERNRERKTKSDVSRNITADLNIEQSTEGNHFLSAITEIVPIREDSESDFCSLSSLSMQLRGEKVANADYKGSKTPPAEDCENWNSLPFPSSQSALKPSTSFSPSHWATGHFKTKGMPANTFFFNHRAEFVISHEKDHGDETDRNINEVVLCSDAYENTQQLVERKSAQSPTLRPVSCSSLDAGSLLHSISHRAVDMAQSEGQANHPEKPAHGQTEGLVMTFVTEEIEKKLTTQKDKECTVDSICPLGNSRESPGSVGNEEEDKCHIISVIKNTCHRDSEDLSSETHNEVCFQMDFPLSTPESNSTMPAANELLPIEKMWSRDADQYGNQDEKTTGPARFPPDPAEYQKLAPIRPNSEGGENKYDSKDNYYHQIDILLSPQKQKLLKDQNLEIISLQKLSQELALKAGKARDGSQEDPIDQWARRRQQFRNEKRCSSAGGSSFARSITEGSVTSDDGRSMDLGFRVDIEEKGFYTENFHSAAWVFRGDNGNPEDSPRCLSKKPRPVAVRERTVRLFKGTGDYPWGFRIQFSKPIMVTEVDANSAAEEAGLQVGDVVLSVNGTEVTSAEHAEAVHLARKGPDILTLVVGSDISRCPNTPWPTCRGYLHKRTHSGFVKGWRKRWFVLKHDSCLRYYKHKKDEGKLPPLEAIKLEGAEVSVDSSLGKPFVFNCIPPSGKRIFCLCATSNQEMKRWLQAMDKAAHPIRQNHVWEDVTLHNSSLPPLAIKAPECLGLLHQLDRSTDTWVQHYCILKDGCLYFYAGIRSTQASGGLYLQGYKVKEQIHSFKQSVIELQPPSEEFKTFYFCAENQTENLRWITALKMSIKKWLPLHQAIQDFMNRPLEETKM